jgi:uncharacterized damage-inducible protein DinB
MKEQLLGQVDSMYEFFERSTRVLTEEDSTFAPTEGVFTAAGHVAHVAQTIDWFLDGAFNPNGFSMEFEELEKAVREITSLADAQAWVKRSVEKAREVINSTPEEDWGQPLPDGPIMGGMPRAMIFGAMTDHKAHHRGALTVYARLRGKTAPMPYMEMDQPI